jgi:hypothetical protein
MWRLRSGADGFSVWKGAGQTAGGFAAGACRRGAKGAGRDEFDVMRHIAA